MCKAPNAAPMSFAYSQLLPLLLLLLLLPGC
jgi:hypothetical protein